MLEFHLKTIGSTNDFAKETFSGEEILVTADEQTKGRGRQGHSFFSPKGGVYFSYAVPEKEISEPEFLTIKTAVSVLSALEKQTLKTFKIKWVNDIFLEDKKVCGILCEYCQKNHDGHDIGFYVIGVGVNVGDIDFPEELSGIAGSAGDIDKESFIGDVIGALKSNISAEELISVYDERSYLKGKNVVYFLDGREMTGVVMGVNGQGNLRVYDGSTEHILISGEVSVRPEDGSERV